jgi:phosphate transport system substrate-binding protein
MCAARNQKETTEMMRSNRMRNLVIASALSAGLLAAACSSDNGAGSGGSTGSDVSGNITVSGSSTVQPITSLVAELFNQDSPNVHISVDGPGTTDGFVLFCKGETDLQDASRPIEPEEKKACQKGGVHYVQLEVGLDGITVMTNSQNSSVTCLNDGDLYALFGPESEDFTTWSDANDLAQQVGGTGNFPAEPLQITAPGQESGTYDAFIELSGIPGIAEKQGLPESEWETLRKDYQASPNDNVIIQAMEGSPSALGFVGFAFADQAGDQVKKIQIDGGDGCVEPSKATIADGTYPLSRSLFIYVNTDKLSSNPALKSFVDFYMTDDGIKTSVTQSDYVELPQTRIDASRSDWQGAS